MGLFILKLLLYSDTHDSHQAETKRKNWVETVDLVADLQIPIMTSFSFEESFENISQQSEEIDILGRFLKSISEEAKEKRALEYLAKSYEEVLHLYQEIHNDVDPLDHNRKIGNVYNEIGKKHIDSLILKSISMNDDDSGLNCNGT